MRTRTSGFVAVLGLLLYPVARADNPSAGSPTTPGEIHRAVLRGYVYHLPPPARIVVPVITANPAAVEVDADAPVVRLAALQVNGKPDQTYREVNAAVAEESLSVPCDIFVRNTPKYQFRALGPPLKPMICETPSEQLHALFPLVTMAW